MDTTTLVRILCVALLCAFAACSTPDSNSGSVEQSAGASATEKITSAGVVAVTAQPVVIAAGATTETTVILKIRDGYHVNANPPTYSYLKATELEIPASDGVVVSSIDYPPALSRQFAFEKQPLAVYEGETALKVTLKADQSAKKGARHVSGILRIQACDNEVCYPPGTKDVTIPIEVR